jgi:hypothetical protein
MKRIYALLVFLSYAAFSQAAVTYVASIGGYTTVTACNAGGGSITPVAGDDLVAVIETFTGSPVFSSVTSTVGATIITDSPYPGGSGVQYAVYRVHNASAVSQGITVNFVASTNCYEWLYDITPAALDQVTSIATGSITAFLTNSLTPSSNGALLIAVAGLTLSRTISTWTNSFTAVAQNRTAGPTAYSAYLNQATAASVAAGATISSSATWSGLLLDYVPISTVLPAAFVTSKGHVLVSNGKPVVIQ